MTTERTMFWGYVIGGLLMILIGVLYNYVGTKLDERRKNKKIKDAKI